MPTVSADINSFLTAATKAAANTVLGLGTGNTPAFAGTQVSSGATGFTLKSDSARVTTAPVSYFRPVAESSAMILDLMPSGPGTPTNQLSTGVCWIDLVNRDLTTVADPTNWAVARMAVAESGAVSLGSYASGTTAPQTVSINGAGVKIYNQATSGATPTMMFGIENSTIAAGDSGWFNLYPTFGLFIKSRYVAWSDSAFINFYDSAVGLTSIDLGMKRNANGVLEINNGSAGTFRDLKLRTLIASPGIGTTLTPAANGDLVVEATSNTSVTIKLKGSDGVVRSVALTLA